MNLRQVLQGHVHLRRPKKKRRKNFFHLNKSPKDTSKMPKWIQNLAQTLRKKRVCWEEKKNVHVFLDRNFPYDFSCIFIYLLKKCWESSYIQSLSFVHGGVYFYILRDFFFFLEISTFFSNGYLKLQIYSKTNFWILEIW